MFGKDIQDGYINGNNSLNETEIGNCGKRQYILKNKKIKQEKLIKIKHLPDCADLNVAGIAWPESFTLLSPEEPIWRCNDDHEDDYDGKDDLTIMT